MNPGTAMAPARVHPSPPQRSFARFNQWLIRRYITRMRIHGRSENTLRSYGEKLQDFARFLGAKCILAADHTELLQYLAGLYDRRLTKSSVFIYTAALRSFQRFILEMELRSTGALGRLRSPKLPQRIGDFHPDEEIKQLLACAQTPRERLIIEMYYGTGCRVSELAQACVEQIDWDERMEVGRIIVLGEGNKEHKVFFGRDAEKALREYLQGRTNGPLFVGSNHWEYDYKLERRQSGGLALDKRSNTWTGFWRETRHLPDGSTKRILRGKAIGTLKEFPTREFSQPGHEREARTGLKRLGPVGSSYDAKGSASAGARRSSSTQNHHGRRSTRRNQDSPPQAPAFLRDSIIG